MAAAFTVVTSSAAAVGSLSCVGVADAFSTPPAQISVNVPHSSFRWSGERPVLLAANKGNSDDIETNEAINNPFDEIAKPLFTAATSAFLATSLLFSSPLLPPPQAQAAPVQSTTATSIDIDVRSIPALTRKAIVNREKLTNYLIDSFKSFKPILDLLSESDTVTVKPPKDVKGAINQALTKGDAQFLVNGEAVDVRLESVPGVIVVRIINPNIPRLPFLRDGTAALKFVDGIVDEAPNRLEKVAEGVEKVAGEVSAVEKFIFMGAPTKPPIQYKGSSLDYFLSSKTLIAGKSVNLGVLGDLTNGEVVLLGITTAVVASYSASYAYYVSLQQEADRAAEEKKTKMAATKKAKADAAKKKKADAAAETKAEADKSEKEAGAKVVKEAEETRAGFAAMAETTNEAEDTEGGGESPKGRKRDAFKKLFGRGKQ